MDKLELVQTKYQSVFSRLYELVCNMIWYIGFAVIASIFFSVEFDFSLFVIVTLAIPIFIILMLWLVQTGPTKRIFFTQDGFDYYSFGSKRVVRWSQYGGYKISKTIPHQIRIKVHDRSDIVFAYYTFSSAQRKLLFSMLDEERNSN